MLCPRCDGQVVVREIVENFMDDEAYRKRLCTNCGYQFFTVEYEVIQNKKFKKELSRCRREGVERRRRKKDE